jgi:hypothetical protein
MCSPGFLTSAASLLVEVEGPDREPAVSPFFLYRTLGGHGWGPGTAVPTPVCPIRCYPPSFSSHFLQAAPSPLLAPAPLSLLLTGCQRLAGLLGMPGPDGSWLRLLTSHPGLQLPKACWHLPGSWWLLDSPLPLHLRDGMDPMFPAENPKLDPGQRPALSGGLEGFMAATNSGGH